MISLIAPQRKQDKHGSGAYGARRGKRLHKGVDFAAWPGSVVLSGVRGEVSKIGFPYPPEDAMKGHLRYVEILTPKNYRVRYFYVKPTVSVGQTIVFNNRLGTVQNLFDIYDRYMTPHVHLEVINPAGENINPLEFFSYDG